VHNNELQKRRSFQSHVQYVYFSEKISDKYSLTFHTRTYEEARTCEVLLRQLEQRNRLLEYYIST